MRGILAEDECNDTYGRCRMYQALKLKYPARDIPGERTICRIMEKAGLDHKPKRRPDGITRADRNARKPEDLIRRDFTARKPPGKCVTDITEIPAKDGNAKEKAAYATSLFQKTATNKNIIAKLRKKK